MGARSPAAGVSYSRNLRALRDRHSAKSCAASLILLLAESDYGICSWDSFDDEATNGELQRPRTFGPPSRRHGGRGDGRLGVRGLLSPFSGTRLTRPSRRHQNFILIPTVSHNGCLLPRSPAPQVAPRPTLGASIVSSCCFRAHAPSLVRLIDLPQPMGRRDGGCRDPDGPARKLACLRTPTHLRLLRAPSGFPSSSAP